MARKASYRSHDDQKVALVKAYVSSFRMKENFGPGGPLYLDSHEERDSISKGKDLRGHSQLLC